MNDEQARKLATRIIDSWPTGPKAYIWRDFLIGLDSDVAADTYRELLGSLDRCTVGQFKAEYSRRIRTEQLTHAGTRWTGREIGLDEYLGRLRARALEGKQEAVDELGNWERWLATPSEPT